MIFTSSEGTKWPLPKPLQETNPVTTKLSTLSSFTKYERTSYSKRIQKGKLLLLLLSLLLSFFLFSESITTVEFLLSVDSVWIDSDRTSSNWCLLDVLVPTFYIRTNIFGDLIVHHIVTLSSIYYLSDPFLLKESLTSKQILEC